VGKLKQLRMSNKVIGEMKMSEVKKGKEREGRDGRVRSPCLQEDSHDCVM
jgi:hypothetical protein